VAIVPLLSLCHVATGDTNPRSRIDRASFKLHLSTDGKRVFSTSVLTTQFPSDITSAPSLSVYRQCLKTFSRPT